jgi:hypothetical protein
MKSKRLLALIALLSIWLFANGCATKAKKVDIKAAFWPPYPDEPRLQYLVSFASSTDVAPQKSGLDELVYGKETQQNLNLAKPYGVDMYDGKIYVCDLRNASITVLDLRKHQTLILGRTGTDTLQTPSDIAISPDGIKYVADLGKGRIFVFDQTERQLGSFGHEGLKPVGVAVYQNELYVCDFAKQRVEVLDRMSGSTIRTIGEAGQGPGQFIRPLGIAVDEQGNVYVTDVLNCRMQKFDHAGKLVTAFGITSANAGGFVRPEAHRGGQGRNHLRRRCGVPKRPAFRPGRPATDVLRSGGLASGQHVSACGNLRARCRLGFVPAIRPSRL